MEFYSHPDKLLSKHIISVFDKTSELTELSIAKAAALFHDIGKLNPNFQKKLLGINNTGYSHHAYLSAYIWLHYLYQHKNFMESLNIQSSEQIIAATLLIARHHGDLPNLNDGVFNLNEAEKLKIFLRNNPVIPVQILLTELGSLIKASDLSLMNDEESVENVLSLSFSQNMNPEPLRFFLETRYAFACLLNADKSDAGGYAVDKKSVVQFCDFYSYKLNDFLAKLKQDTVLNKLRTTMRLEVNSQIHSFLESQQRNFALTAPTGSGKTLMLLSAANEIIRKKGAYRIIYILPFLSITEQVHAVCTEIFGDDVRRIDSRTENNIVENCQKELDDNPGALRKLLENQFSEDTFNYPFIITTFVRFFETLLSNKNSTLLKLPNFSHSIFLIDEIQALPPRLYTFFVALLDTFCRRFDSYAIISSATMPDFRLPESDLSLIQFFNGYTPPPELLSSKYFRHRQFNRYSISGTKDKVTIEELCEIVIKERESVLVILNTIDDSKQIYNRLVNELHIPNIILLNTHFTPNDRLKKIRIARRALRRGIKFITLSTQLIEAGVDIDFPIVYRDLAPLSNIVQSAGRCNRNNQLTRKGKLVLFNLSKEGRSRWKLIYRGEDEKLVSLLSSSVMTSELEESDLFVSQRAYFDQIHSELLFGYHQSKKFSPNGEIYFVERIKQAAFEEIGKFQLIDDQEYGEEVRYYIPTTKDDLMFDNLQTLIGSIKQYAHNDYEHRRIHQLKIDTQLRKMAGQIVQIRIKSSDSKPISERDTCCGIVKLNMMQYNSKTGVPLDSSNQII